jgi:diaminopimelate epimerase
MEFAKYNALGNDYVVVAYRSGARALTGAQVRRICDRHFGLGSDGILVDDCRQAGDRPRLRILNPDGSEAEKSGNGIRIFARHLWDAGRASLEPFEIETPGGTVTCRVHERGRSVTVEMGRVSFDSAAIPVTGPRREVLGETMSVGGRSLSYSAATIGNPHCVVLCDRPSEAETRALGPLIESDPRFPQRTNVQFLAVLARDTLRIEIWERGAGYTLASGTSSCAAAAVAHRLGLCDSSVRVEMPGGALHIDIGRDYDIVMTGPVAKVAEGRLADELLLPAQEPALD